MIERTSPDRSPALRRSEVAGVRGRIRGEVTERDKELARYSCDQYMGKTER